MNLYITISIIEGIAFINISIIAFNSGLEVNNLKKYLNEVVSWEIIAKKYKKAYIMRF